MPTSTDAPWAEAADPPVVMDRAARPVQVTARDLLSGMGQAGRSYVVSRSPKRPAWGDQGQASLLQAALASPGNKAGESHPVGVWGCPGQRVGNVADPHITRTGSSDIPMSGARKGRAAPTAWLHNERTRAAPAWAEQLRAGTAIGNDSAA